MLLTLHNVAVRPLYVRKAVSMRAFVVIANHRQVEKIGDLKEHGQAMVKRLVGRQLGTEVVVFLDVVVVPVAHVGKSAADVASRYLGIPSVVSVFEEEGEVCHVGRLAV